MNKLVKELNAIVMPNRLAIIGAVVIIITSMFSSHLDSIVGFLMGCFLFFLGFGMSLNSKSNIQTNREVEWEKVVINTFVENYLFF
jgi:hypothetical protein